MSWKKSGIDTQDNRQVFLVFLLCVLVVISMVANKSLILLPIAFVTVYLLSSRLISKQIGENLEIDNPNRSIRLFEEEEADLMITIKNESYLPYFNGLVSFTTNTKIISNEANLHRSKNNFRIPFHLLGKREATLTVPFQAMGRGVSQIKDIRFTFPHLLNFEDVVLSYTKFYKTEIVIYPKLAVVHGIEGFPYNKLGTQVASFSPFEDQTRLLGTRNYKRSDPFNRIHWKASAKSQILQTKVLERNLHISWTLIINISSKSQLGNRYLSENVEQYLSQAAYLCQSIIKQGYPVELYINIKGTGNWPYYLERGKGTDHLKKIFEFLARLEETGRIMELGNLLHWADHKMNDSNLLAIVGEMESSDYNYFINKWISEGRKVFHVTHTDTGEHGYLEEVKPERPVHYDVK